LHESQPPGTQQQAPQKAPTTDAEKQFELLKVNKIEDLGLSPDDFDEKMVGAFDVFKERLNSVVDALAQRDDLLREIAVELVNTRDGVKNIAGGAEAQAEAQFNESMDKFYAGLGDEFQDVFGKVPLTRLTEASPLLVAARALSLVAMAVAAAGASADVGAEVPGVGELVEVARVAPWAWAWPVVRDEWRALCEAATAAHEGDVWRRCVATVHASGEVELARLWGATLPGTEVL
jgi:hypothetical protein